MTIRLPLITAMLVLTSTTACLPILAGGAATGGVAIAQERSVGTAIDDAGIQTKIWNKFLQSNTQNLYSNVGIEVTEGRVLLTGPVATQDSAARAVQLAWDVEGVREVINEIQVTERGGPGNFAKDTWITTQVKSRLIAEKGIKSVNYTIETVNGVVYVMGIAQNETELSQVLNVASRVKGVTQVVSHVRMKDDPRRNLPAHMQQEQYPASQSQMNAPADQGYGYTEPQPVYSEPNYQDSNYTDRYGDGSNSDSGYDSGYDNSASSSDSTFTPQY